jgi:DUF1365 family protein
LRTFGWLFNPLAVYYCWAPNDTGLEALVLEVSNTPWGERHWYVLDARDGRRYAHVAKAMHVSPFLPMDVGYRITWTEPADDLRLHLEVDRDGRAVFGAALALRRLPLDRRRAVAMPARHWLLPLRVSLGIYREALRLWRRRAPFHRHPGRPRRLRPGWRRPR